MQIESRTIYVFDGVEFASEKKARTFVENRIAALLMLALKGEGARATSPRDEIALVEAVLNNAAALIPSLVAYTSAVDEND